MKRRKQRILWVTFDFPPRQSSAVFRPIKIYKYMDKDKYEVDFLTTSMMLKFKGAVQDNTLLEEVYPRPPVYRLPNLVFDDLVHLITKRSRKMKKRSDEPKKENTKIGTSEDPRPGITKKIYRLFIMSFYFPDQFFVWGWLAAFKALCLHRKKRYDLVYTTSYPQSGHIAGMILRHFRTKWVVDYRYGGILWEKKMLHYPKKGIRQTIEFYYQRHVLRKADYVVTQSETIKKEFCRLFSLNSSKVMVIPSGYDEYDFREQQCNKSPFTRKENEIHILHSGVWYLNKKEVAQMVKKLNRLHLNIKEKGYEIVLHALGYDLFNNDQKENDIQFRYHYYGVIPHQYLIPYLLAADCYLVSSIAAISGTTLVRGYLPSKLWENLRGGKPILLFGLKDDDAWQITDEAGAGLYMGLLDEEESISADKLLGFLNEMRPLNPKVSQHSWESRAHSMQDVFQRVLAEERA